MMRTRLMLFAGLLPGLVSAPLSARALPADKAAVMAVVDRFVAGVGARDPAAVAATLRSETGALFATEAADGTHSLRALTHDQFTARFAPGPERYEERITHPVVELDGDAAMVWADYVFLIDGKLHHCGVDHLGLVREQGEWKIATATFTSRTTSCGKG